METLEKPFRLNDRFSISHFLGKGGQGTTYFGVDEQTGEAVTVKKLDMATVEHWKSVDLFRREVAVLFQLRHPSIPRCVEGFRGSDSNFYLIEEFVEGKDLRKLQKSGFRWSEEDLTKVMTDMLSVLAYLHTQVPSIVHRDLKPANIIQRPDGSHALIDFGAVTLAMCEHETGSTIIGTPGYMPLEQISGKSVPASDLYALAATIVSLATGERPSDLPLSRGKIEYKQLRRLPPRLERSIDQMLEPFVEDRPQSVEALIGAAN